MNKLKTVIKCQTLSFVTKKSTNRILRSDTSLILIAGETAATQAADPDGFDAGPDPTVKMN